MELNQAKAIHAKLVEKLRALRVRTVDGTASKEEVAQIPVLTSQIGHFGNAWNPKLSAKAEAFFK